ncbi:F-box and FNIP repeat-containing [Acanthamoeba polyphaga mimivirus]|uniref:F-box and FNIP repeat-containing n=1 Tax=Acanthamoeba polyphaga mimivirus TaxID=212035 RepID=A0A2L2DKK8_MIMIV|nr:F-box and FNIP repeat-containing [Acanthamoeba polyphaga mimivirus]
MYFITDREKLILCSLNKNLYQIRNQIYFYESYQYDKIKDIMGKFKNVDHNITHDIIFENNIYPTIFSTKQNTLSYIYIPNIVTNLRLRINIKRNSQNIFENTPQKLVTGNFPKNLKNLVIDINERIIKNDSYKHKSKIIFYDTHQSNHVLYDHRYIYQFINDLSHLLPYNIKSLKIHTNLINENFQIQKHQKLLCFNHLNVETLHLTGDFNEPINNIIPNTVKILELGDNFNQNIYNCIPNSVTHLTFGSGFNQDIKNCIPNGVTHLTFGFDFNQNINDCIPNSIKSIKFGYHFNQDVTNCFPNTIQKITFDKSFNQNISNCFKTNEDTKLIYLKFGDDFNKIFDGKNMSKLESLFLGYYFNQEIINIPRCIKTLILPHHFNQKINIFPDTITYLVLGYNFQADLPDCLPKHLEHLKIFSNCKIKKPLPNSIKYLELLGQFNQPIDNILPQGIKKLQFGNEYNHPINNCIPHGVTHLYFGIKYHNQNNEISKFNHSIKNSIPNTIIHLQLSDEFNQPINECLPNSIKNLFFGKNFNQPIIGCIPDSVENLFFGTNFNQPLNNCLPKNLKQIGLNSGYGFNASKTNKSINKFKNNKLLNKPKTNHILFTLDMLPKSVILFKYGYQKFYLKKNGIEKFNEYISQKSNLINLESWEKNCILYFEDQ